MPRPALRPLAALAALCWLAALAPAARAQTWADKSTTPIFIQDGFGTAGNALPNNGLEYCVPVSAAMSLSYLGQNGFTQLAPVATTTASALNLVRVLGGLMGTTAFGGTTGNGQLLGYQDYLAAKGVGAGDYALAGYNSPTIATLASLNQNQTVVAVTFGYYSAGANPSRTGGHILALVGQSASGPNGTVTANNPLPSTFLPLPDLASQGRQTLSLVPTTGGLAGFGALQLDPAQAPGYGGSARTVLERAVALTVNANQLSSAAPAPATWTLTAAKSIDTNGGNLSVLAPVAGAGGFTKNGLGTLSLENAVTTTGATTVNAGTLASTASAGRPFGSGSLTVNSGALSLTPVGGANSSVVLTGADGAGATFTYGGAAEVALNANGRNVVAFTVGGNSGNGVANLVRAGQGTLVIAPALGLGALGSVEAFAVNGSGANLPAVANGIVSPSIVGRDTDGSLAFLSYTNGGGFSPSSFVPATGEVRASVNSINTLPSSTARFHADINQTVAPGTTVQVATLKVGPGVTISGGISAPANLQVGPQTAGAQAGLILNGGTISTSTLQFGAAEALVAVGGAGGRINATVQGTGSLVKFGAGALTLAGANSFSGPVLVSQGTLIAANATGSATGTGAVTVGRLGTLQVNAGATAGTASAPVAVQGGGTLRLGGGTVAGGLTLQSGGTLTGTGTINGSSSLAGSVAGLTNATFTGPVTSAGTFNYAWRLNSLDANPVNAGVNWSTLNFTSGVNVVLGASAASSVKLSLDLADGLPDPNTGDPFWQQSHTWRVMTAAPFFNTIYYNYNFPAFAGGSFSAYLDPAFTGLFVAYSPAPVPEPALALVAGALVLMAARRRRGPAPALAA